MTGSAMVLLPPVLLPPEEFSSSGFSCVKDSVELARKNYSKARLGFV